MPRLKPDNTDSFHRVFGIPVVEMPDGSIMATPTAFLMSDLKQTSHLMTITPDGNIIFGIRSARPILHGRRARDIYPPCILEIAAPVDYYLSQLDGYRLSSGVEVPIEGVKKRVQTVREFATVLRERWVKTRRRCPTCKKRVNKIEIPLNLSPAHPHYQWFMDQLIQQRSVLSQLDTFKEAQMVSEDDGD